MPDLTGRTVLVAGATSTVGHAAVRALAEAGARVVAVGRSEERLAPLVALGARGEAADLTDEAAVEALAGRLHGDGLTVDGVLHLVGGWRGGGGLAGQTEADYRVLEASLTALRHVSREFFDDLARSPAGRLAIVSSTAVERPLAGGASYAAVKAASEAWVRAVAHGFEKHARDAGEPGHAAAVVLRVTSLRGLEEAVAGTFVGLWDAGAEANGSAVRISADEGAGEA
ncbi:SDR family oxidoreductase [Demequina sp. SYSU T00192]|uniref:SDR family oxidoreductase n=1 Tax=Demequina litoralis TaxID=3051660 RepID=A0ABT8GC18_9MICO|nr:SDR family oxidoreductase [Demequina sp. SYSU T00192]MDN4476678.1 SDR family oxidoreductase [Demequina sp. SYSU T00192]